MFLFRGKDNVEISPESGYGNFSVWAFLNILIRRKKVIESPKNKFGGVFLSCN